MTDYLLHLPVDVGLVSDGYHSFNELYDHRCFLFIALMHSHKDMSWKSRLHADGTSFPDWFIAGMELPTGQITYHVHHWLWDEVHVQSLERAPGFDGHTSTEVLQRLSLWVGKL